MTTRTSHTVDGARLEQARAALELTQAELATRVGVHRVTLTKIENGAPCSLDVLERIAGELHVGREWLIGMPEPDDVDVDTAKRRMSDAMAQMAEALGDFTAAVKVLEQRAREAGQ